MSSKWYLKPLEGKYYSTDIESEDGLIQVHGFITDDPYRSSDRELEEGWTEDMGYDHVELQSTYETALKIVKALNDSNSL